jgi:O-antigen ligase
MDSLGTSVLMTYLTASRTAIICLPSVMILVWFLTNFYRTYVQIISSITCFISGIFSSFLIELFRSSQEDFTDAREDSSRIRKIIARISLERFKDAPIWGHGHLERGFKTTANMPIGSHHTWIGLLFVKGLVGFFSLLIPMLCSFVYLVIKAHKNETAKLGLSFLLTLIIFTFTDNQETLAYLYYPGLIIMGISFKEEKQVFASQSKIISTNWITDYN